MSQDNNATRVSITHQDGSVTHYEPSDGEGGAGVLIALGVAGLLAIAIWDWISNFPRHPAPLNLFAGYLYYAGLCPIKAAWMAATHPWRMTVYPNLNIVLGLASILPILMVVVGVIFGVYKLFEWQFEYFSWGHTGEEILDNNPPLRRMVLVFSGVLTAYFVSLVVCGGLTLCWVVGFWLFQK